MEKLLPAGFTGRLASYGYAPILTPSFQGFPKLQVTWMSSPESSFDPLKRREWQHPMDRKYHQGWIASLNRPGPRYREAEDTYRRALDE